MITIDRDWLDKIIIGLLQESKDHSAELNYLCNSVKSILISQSIYVEINNIYGEVSASLNRLYQRNLIKINKGDLFDFVVLV